MPHYRGDQTKGITPPNLGLDVTFEEHVVKARGRKSNFTSVSENQLAAQRFGTVRTLKEIDLANAGHQLVCSSQIVAHLKQIALQKSERAQLAVRALPRVKKKLRMPRALEFPGSQEGKGK